MHVFGIPDPARLNVVPPPERTATGKPARRSPSNRSRRVGLTSWSGALASAGPRRSRSVRSCLKIGNRKVRRQRFGGDRDFKQCARGAGKGALEGRREIRRSRDLLAQHPVSPGKMREIRIREFGA